MVALFTDHTAQQVIDLEITKLETAILQLKKQRNAYAAVNQLPDDVLAMIFVSYRAGFPLETSNTYWLPALSVCSHWRNVMLASPPFWAKICLDRPKYASMMMDRSKNVLLHIQCRLCDPVIERDGFWPVVREAMSRSDRLAEILLRVDEEAIPHLESLLEIVDEHHFRALRSLTMSRSQVTFHETYDLRRTIPWSHFPSLRTLELYHVFIPPEVPKIPSLVKLAVFSINLTFTLSWVVRFLQSTPNIEEVELIELSAMVDYGHLPSTTTILPKLRILEVEGTDRDPRLFNVIDIPSSTRVAASFRDDGVKSDTTTDVLSALGTLFARLTATSHGHIVQTMVINVLRPQSQQLVLSSDGDTLPFLDLDLDLMYIGRHEYSKTWRSKLPISKIPELTIDDKFTPKGESSVWSSIIPSFQSLKSLAFKRFRPHTLLAVLSDMTAASTHNGHVNTNLTVVVFVEIAWAQLEEELNTFFKHRREIGLPVHKLRIQKCAITQKQVDGFAQFADVDWDGVTSLED